MSSIVDQVTTLYVCIDDFFQAHPRATQWRRSPHQHPTFSDAEVLTVALLQGCLGVATLKHAHRYAATNLRAAFPHLPSYQQWLARLHALSGVVGQFLQSVGERAAGSSHAYLLDSKPIPVCKPLRHGRVRLLRDEGAYFGKSSTGWFFGFKLHVLIQANGAILVALLTPGNGSDPAVAPALSASLQSGQEGIGLADLAYQSEALFACCAEEADLYLVTPAAAAKGTEARALVSSVRERIETVFSQLWNRFIDRVLSRSWEGLWSTLKLKMLHHNLCLAGILPA
jgi:transposase